MSGKTKNEHIVGQDQRQLEEPDLSKSETEKIATKYWEKSQSGIRQLEESIHAKVIVLYFRAALASADVDYVFRQIAIAGHQQRLAIVLRGPGGSIDAAARLVFMFRKYCDELIFIIPSKAASACTIMALGGDKILMGPLSALSPIDTSISGHPLAPKDMDGYPVAVEITEIQKFIELCNSTMKSDKVDSIKESPYGLLSEHVHPVMLGAIQRSLSLSKLITTDVLKTHIKDEERINYIVDQLNDAFPDHAFPITLEKAQELKIQAEEMPHHIHELTIPLVDAMQSLTNLKSEEIEDVKYTYAVDAVFETRDWRTVYFVETKYNLVDGRWKFGTKKEDYRSYRATQNPEGKSEIKEVA